MLHIESGQARGRGRAPRRLGLVLSAWLAGACGLAPETGAGSDHGATPDGAPAGPPDVTGEPTDAALAPGAAADGGDLDGGLDGGAASTTGCPVEMARVGRFCVDRWEAHLVTLGADGTEQPHAHNERPSASERYQARSTPDSFPQAYISRVESEAACRNAGKRLCSFNEWRRACHGKRGLRYPYGARFEKDRCNVGKQHLLPQYFGADPGRWKYDDHFNSPILDVEPGYLAKTGQYAGCGNEEGVLDMVGNLHEWVSGTVTEDFMERLEKDDVERNKQPWHEGNGSFLGGFFSTLSEHGPGCTFVTVAHEPRYHDYSTGFRCCADAKGGPEPGSDKKPKRTPGKGRSKSAAPTGSAAAAVAPVASSAAPR